MANKTYIVNHRKLNLNVQLDGQSEGKMQRVPMGYEIDLDPETAKPLVESKKLLLKTGSNVAVASKAEDSKKKK